MQLKNSNTQAFFELLRAGLWEKEARLLQFNAIDYSRVLSLAEEQSVVGLVAAGLEHVTDVKVPKEDVLQFVGQTLQLEQQNQAMNYFIGVLVDKMRKAGIYTLLLKGQGVAQCYERPLWRSCGDVDFFLSEDNYLKARDFLVPLANSINPEGVYSKHLGMTIDSWVVELHGSLRCGLSSRIDRVMDKLRDDVFWGGNVRSWMNGRTPIFLLGINNDAIYTFVHFLNHYYKGGLGIRQICDWCRLLWLYRDIIDEKLLKQRLISMFLLSEWKAFAAFAVGYLGMPKDVMPIYDDSARWHKKAKCICNFVLEVGNMGHNRDNSYIDNKSYVIRKLFSFSRRCRDLARHARIFPLSSISFFPRILINGITAAARGE